MFVHVWSQKVYQTLQMIQIERFEFALWLATVSVAQVTIDETSFKHEWENQFYNMQSLRISIN